MSTLSTAALCDPKHLAYFLRVACTPLTFEQTRASVAKLAALLLDPANPLPELSLGVEIVGDPVSRPSVCSLVTHFKPAIWQNYCPTYDWVQIRPPAPSVQQTRLLQNGMVSLNQFWRVWRTQRLSHSGQREYQCDQRPYYRSLVSQATAIVHAVLFSKPC